MDNKVYQGNPEDSALLADFLSSTFHEYLNAGRQGVSHAATEEIFVKNPYDAGLQTKTLASFRLQGVT